jgi:hypothetical protein
VQQVRAVVEVSISMLALQQLAQLVIWHYPQAALPASVLAVVSTYLVRASKFKAQVVDRLLFGLGTWALFLPYLTRALCLCLLGAAKVAMLVMR